MDTKELKKIKAGLRKARMQEHKETNPSPRVKASMRALTLSNSAKVTSLRKVDVCPSKVLTADGYVGLSRKK
jgi:hypothetical protein